MKWTTKALMLALILACAPAYAQYRDATGTTTATILDIRGTSTAPALAQNNYARCFLDTSSTPTLKCSISGGGFLNWIGSGGGGGGGSVLSVFGRTGSVTSQFGDYQGSQIALSAPGNGITGTNVQTAMEQLAARTGSVSSVFGRVGPAVVATTGDYTVSQITGAAPNTSPTFLGDPRAPTPTTGDNDTSIATTAFVQSAVGAPCTTCVTTNTAQSVTAAKTLTKYDGAALILQPSQSPATNTTAITVNSTIGVSLAKIDSEGDATVHDLNVAGATTGIGAASVTVTSNGSHVSSNVQSSLNAIDTAVGTNTTNIALKAPNASPSITGNMSVAGTLTERGRGTPMGEWVSFTPTMTAASGTWTGGTVTSAKYMMVGKSMTVNVKISSASVSTSTVWLNVTIPGGYTTAGEMGQTATIIDNGTPGRAWLATSSAGGTGLTLFKDMALSTNWSASSSATSIQFNITFEVQ
jgi:hypothetical protein